MMASLPQTIEAERVSAFNTASYRRIPMQRPKPVQAFAYPIQGLAIGAAMAAVLGVATGIATPAQAAITFLNTWGSEGGGNGQFRGPADVAVSPTGEVYVVDTGNQRIQKFTSSGDFITAWGGFGFGGGTFMSPSGIAVAPTGDVYVADWENEFIQKFTSSGSFLFQFHVDEEVGGLPTDVAVSGVGNVYVASGSVSVYTSSGNYLGSWSTPEVDDIAVTPSGEGYMTDIFSGRVFSYSSIGGFITEWGGFGNGPGQFDTAEGVAVGPTGDVYVADFGNDRIQKFTSSGQYITQWGTFGIGPGEFVGPKGVAVGSDGTIYIADAGNDRIQRFFDLDIWASGNFPLGPDLVVQINSVDSNIFTVGSGKNLQVTGTLTIGGIFPGALAIQGGGKMTSGLGQIAQTTGVSGKVMVVGSGATWANTGDLSIGFRGNGELLIGAGGKVTNTLANIGDAIDGVGRVEVVGLGATWENSTDLRVGHEGTADLLIDKGGRVSSSTSTIGVNPGGTGAVLVTGPASRWINSGTLTVGDEGTGSMTIEGGASVSTAPGFDVRLGVNATGAGTTVVSGPGSRLDSGRNLHVGRLGSGALTIRDGATVTNENAIISTDAGSMGTVSIEGAGSKWTNSGQLIVGHNGDGELTITQGATVENTGSAAITFIGFSSGTVGRVTMTGAGSRWLIPGALRVGQSGTGRLNVLSGAFVRSGLLTAIGNLSGSHGTVVVDGPGSTWEHQDELRIGSSVGTGQLTVSNGGSVEVTQALLVRPLGTLTLDRANLSAASLSVDSGALATIPSSTLSITGTITNNGQILLGSLSSSQIEGGTLVNNGLLDGGARINAVLQNSASGEVRSSGANAMLFTEAGNTNGGLIRLIGGAVEFTQDLVTEPGGRVVGRGIFTAAGGHTLAGQMQLSGGFTDVFGDTVITGGVSGGKLIISGGGTATFYDNMEHNGLEIRVTEGSIATFFGTLTGDGPLTGMGTVNMEGVHMPGSSPGQVSFGGNLQFGNSATVEIELADSEHDQVNVTANVSLAGNLDVKRLGGFTPTYGGTFDILTYGSRSGVFSQVSDHIISPVLALGQFYDDVDGTLSLLATAPGDANGDLVVNIIDFGLLAGNFNQPGSWEQGDFDGNGVTNILDFGLLAANFNGDFNALMDLATELGITIPEPNTTLILVAAGVVGFLQRQRGTEHAVY